MPFIVLLPRKPHEERGKLTAESRVLSPRQTLHARWFSSVENSLRPGTLIPLSDVTRREHLASPLPLFFRCTDGSTQG